jgi:thiamine-phosphate diphosphorylase
VTSPLPRLLVLTDRTQCRSGDLVGTVRSLVDAGVRAVVLREKDLPEGARHELAEELRPILHAASGQLLVASDPRLPSDGVHLAAADALPDHRPAIVGRSCHTIAEVVAAEEEGCDYATLSPVFLSSSKPSYGPPLGPDELRRASQRAHVPVYALGGVDSAAKAARCLAATAAGVAVMGLAMREPTTVADLLANRILSARSAS